MNISDIFAPASGTPAAAKGRNELGQEDFLKLLVAQLENQDPSNPADNGEFLSQIAQFSMVSGIDDLGGSFASMADSFYTNQAIQAADLVGKKILTESNALVLTGDERAEGVVAFEGVANGIRVQVQDLGGSVIRTLDLGDSLGGGKPFTWDGLDADGNPMPAGQYRVSAQALVDGQLQAIPVQVFTRVDSVSVNRGEAGISLHLASRENVGLSEVREYR